MKDAIKEMAKKHPKSLSEMIVAVRTEEKGFEVKGNASVVGKHNSLTIGDSPSIEF